MRCLTKLPVPLIQWSCTNGNLLLNISQYIGLQITAFQDSSMALETNRFTTISLWKWHRIKRQIDTCIFIFYLQMLVILILRRLSRLSFLHENHLLILVEHWGKILISWDFAFFKKIWENKSLFLMSYIYLPCPLPPIKLSPSPHFILTQALWGRPGGEKVPGLKTFSKFNG